MTPRRSPVVSPRKRIVLTVLAVAVLAGVFAGAAAALRFSDKSYLTPEGIVGKPYAHRFEGVGGCGPALPYTFTILNGALPPGLSLASDGLVSGTPTVAGSFSVWVNLGDQNPPTASWCRPENAQREFTFNIVAALQIEQGALPLARPGVGYDVQLTAKGGGTQAWSVVGGALPAGITLSGSGRLTGATTAVGVHAVSIAVSDGKRSDRKDYALVVSDPLVLSSAIPPDAEVGIPYTSPEPKTTGGVPPFAWAVKEGTLPPGLQLDAATGVISGTPGRAGSFPLQLTLTDRAGVVVTTDVAFQVARKLKITTRRLPNGKVGKPMTGAFDVRGGVAPLTWQLTEGTLPKGLRLAQRTGAVVGKPKQGGRFRFTVTATDELGAKFERKAFLLVKKMTIVTRRLPNGVTGRLYRTELATRKGEAPVRWRILKGALPKGLRLAPRNGLVVGRPKQTGVFRPTLAAIDRFGDVATRRVRLVVRAG